jgi:hypothetical protein
MRNAHRIIVGIPEDKIIFGALTGDLEEVKYEDFDWIHLIQYRER